MANDDGNFSGHTAAMIKKPKPPTRKLIVVPLQEWRTYRGMSQEQLADAIGTSKGQISKLENGRLGIDVSWLQKFALALKCEPRDLLSPPPPGGDGIIRSDDKAAEAAEIVATLSGKAQDAALRMLLDLKTLDLPN